MAGGRLRRPEPDAEPDPDAGSGPGTGVQPATNFREPILGTDRSGISMPQRSQERPGFCLTRLGYRNIRSPL